MASGPSGAWLESSLDLGIFCTVRILADYYLRMNLDLAAAFQFEKIEPTMWKSVIFFIFVVFESIVYFVLKMDLDSTWNINRYLQNSRPLELFWYCLV